MKTNNVEKKYLKVFAYIIAGLALITFFFLFIPGMNPMKFLPQIKEWSYLHFLNNTMKVDKLFVSSYPDIREFFASNAILIFCGYLVGIFLVAQLIFAILMFSNRPATKAKGLMFVMIFSVLNLITNVMIMAVVYGANSSVMELGYEKMGIQYEYPAGAIVFTVIGLVQFLLGKFYRRRLMIEKGLYTKMSRSQKIENIKGYAFISPYIIGFIAFTGLPLIFSFFSSFTYYNITAVQKWYGLNNFIKLFTADDYFWKSLYNTGWYVIVSVPLAIIVAMILALLMNMNHIKGLRFFRTVYYLPSVLSGVAVFLLWQWVLDPNAGLLNNFLQIFGIHGPAWLYDAQWTKPALVLMKIWGVGGSTVILLSALQSVPQELYEAGSIDGATGFSKFFKITLPMISPTLFFVMVTGISGAFQVFDSAYIMANGTGGPNNSLLFYNLYLFNTAMADQQMGKASAMAWILFVIIMLFTVIQMIGSRKWVYYEGGSDKK
ncbi:MAG: carbohydrate transporter rane protein 1, family [Herbinix sp.]|jgi:multiple sugar transport system permease protein|nr:carbohydrate transporter rane protein 1, family [Herbinix sp.]